MHASGREKKREREAELDRRIREVKRVQARERVGQAHRTGRIIMDAKKLAGWGSVHGRETDEGSSAVKGLPVQVEYRL